MSTRTRNRRLRAMAEMKGELNFSESERVYSRNAYNGRQPGYYGNSKDSVRRNGNKNADDINYQYRVSKTEPVLYSSDENSVGGRRKLSYRKTRMYSRRGDLHERTMGDSGYYRTYYDNGNGYYVHGQETIKEEPETEKQEPEEVLLCCCGTVEIVDSETCKGMKIFRCYNPDEEVEEETKPLIDKTTSLNYQNARDERLHEHQRDNKIRYRNSRYDSENERVRYSEETATESDTGYDYGYAEIPTRTFEKDRLVTTRERPHSSGIYTRYEERLTRNAAIVSRPRSASGNQRQYHIAERTIQSAPPKQRHVGVQMNTRYVLPDPPKKLVRNVNTQTIPFEEEKPPPRKPRKKLTPAPPRKPKYIGERPKIEDYKTAIIDIEEKKEDVVVVPTEPKKIVIEAPKPDPEPEIEWIYEYKPDPEVIMEPIYDTLPTEPLPLPVKEEPEKELIVKYVEPVTKIKNRANTKKHKRKGNNVHVPPLHLNTPGAKDNEENSHKVVFRVFAKGSTALFHLLPPPKGKSIMVRVGGGWMKVEHHRYKHYPLAITEHNRDANKDKFLFIKSKFMTNKKNVPVAYKKYREEVVKRDEISKQG